MMQEWGLTQEGLGDLCGIKRGTVGTIVNGKTVPDVEALAALKRAKPKLSWDWLLLGKGEMMEGGPEQPYKEHLRAAAALSAEMAKPSKAPETAPVEAGASSTAQRGQVVEHADTVLKLATVEAENGQLRQRLEDAREEILWLRGKSPASSNAAAPASLPALPAPNAIGYHACAERRAAEFDEYVAVRQEEGGVAELV
jgi:transcriptional regulator with XRE-family HTH domain